MYKCLEKDLVEMVTQAFVLNATFLQTIDTE